MTDPTAKTHTTARLAGVLLWLSLAVPLANWVWVIAPLTEGGLDATASGMLAHAGRWRIAIATETLMAVMGIALGLSLYALVERIDRTLARVALFWKLAESVLVAVIALSTFAALQMVTAPAELGAGARGQLHAVAAVFLQLHPTTYVISMVFLGLGTTVFFVLLYRARAIPRPLAGLGVVAFTLVFASALLGVLAPEYASMRGVELVAYLPSCLAEILVGGWLVWRGVDMSAGPRPAAA